MYCDYVDCNGRTSANEEKSANSHHLCHALAGCPKLRDLSLSAFRCCPDLFTMSNWPQLRNLKIDMMFYTGCNGEQDDTEFKVALIQTFIEGKYPCLPKQNILIQTSKALSNP